MMFGRKICMSVVAASMMVVPVERAKANDAAALLGGAIIGGIIVNEVHKNKQRKRTTTSSRSYTGGTTSAQREENRSVQRALNYFGYNVGAADGALGRKSRAGISRYQSDMGYGVDGYLDSHEKDFLLNSHHRALASSHVPPYDQIVASQGQYGLLRTYRNEQLGIATPQVQPQPYAQPTPVPANAPTATQPESVPARSNAALPDFTFGQVARSANEHCNEVNVLTAANGGITTVGRLSDPEFALAEQFCLARTHAMAESTRMEATIPNMSSAQIEQQCKGLTQVIAPQMQGLPTSSPEQINNATATFLQGTGQPMAQLISGGKVCLGVGYRIDDAQMALASAVLLSAGGEAGYGEMISHHLRQGIGTQQAKPVASAWLQTTLNALDQGATPVLGQSADRVAVLRAAQGGAVQQGNAVLPTFGASNN